MNKMVFYTRNNERVEISNFEEFDSGACANIYKQGKTLLKIYNSGCSYAHVLSRNVFDRIQELDLKGVVKLYNDYYYQYAKYKRIFPMNAYIMEYVPGKVDILEQKKDYILNTLYKLEETCLHLAENKIEIFDGNSYNTVFNNEGATLIDIDDYTIRKLKNVSKIFASNKAQILEILRSKIEREIKDKKLDINYYYKALYFLHIDVLKKSIAEEIEKKWQDETLLDNIKNVI